MSRKLKLVIVLVTGISFLWGCATVPRKPKKSIENVREFRGSYNRIWYAAIDALASLEFPIILSQKRDGIITTDWAKFKRRTYSRGITSWREKTNMENIQISLRILSVEDGAEVKVTVFTEDYVGVKGTMWKSHWMKTYSKGNLEKKILTIISGALVGEQVTLVISAQPERMVPDGKSSSLVTVAVIDENGNPIVSANGNIMFGIAGPGKLAGKNPVKIEDGIVAIKVKSTKEPGSIEVMATYQDITSEPITIVSEYETAEAEPGAVEPEAVEPEAVEPETAEPGAVEPETAEPEAAEPVEAELEE